MYLNYYYYYFKNVFDDRFCKSVKDLAKKQKLKKGVVSKNKNETVLGENEFTHKLKLRDSDVCWLNDQWLYDVISPYIEEANKMANWNFDINYFEDLQFTKYKKNQHYDWHLDNLTSTYDTPHNPNIHGTYRKLSFSINLSDPKDFKGGEFYFEFLNSPINNVVECLEIKEKGSIIIFPSFVKHKVAAITKGERNSLVGWALGYPFK
tara:strand:+ start:2611 stop:3231 length:621 start_codon:yes stop_codon:yes gene_type:complete